MIDCRKNIDRNNTFFKLIAKSKSKLQLNKLPTFTTAEETLPEYKVQGIHSARFIIPHYGIFRIAWDWLILLCTFYIAIVVPYNFAFDETEQPLTDFFKVVVSENEETERESASKQIQDQQLVQPNKSSQRPWDQTTPKGQMAGTYKISPRPNSSLFTEDLADSQSTKEKGFSFAKIPDHLVEILFIIGMFWVFQKIQILKFIRYRIFSCIFVLHAKLHDFHRDIWKSL